MPNSFLVDNWAVNNQKGVVFLTVQDKECLGQRYDPFYRYHAMLVIEMYVENVMNEANEAHQVKMYDFLPPNPDQGHPEAGVREQEIRTRDRRLFADRYNLNLDYYSAWNMDRDRILQLEYRLICQLPEQQRGNYPRIDPPHFSLYGSYLVPDANPDANLGPHNCMSWAQRELLIAGLDRQDVTCSSYWDSIAVMPTSHIGYVGEQMHRPGWFS